MASSSSTTSNPNQMNINQSSHISFSFSTPVKLDRSNFMIWRKQVLTTIRGNRLEDFISGNQIIPEQYISNTIADGSVQRITNPAYINWRAQDQTLLGWILSSISEGILNTVLNCENSFEAWRSIEKQFGVQSEARVMQLRYEMNVLRKENMSVEEYCLKVKAVADKLACAGSPVSEKDLLMQILNGLGPGFLDLASIITANKMSYDDAYALLLTHEARMEQNHNTKDLFSANYGMMNANYSQHNFNVNHGSTSMPNGNGSDDNVLICQICHKAGHAADVCWHRHFDGYAPQPRQFGRGRGHKSAYMANFDPQIGFTSQFEDSFATEYPGWYLDSGATHHITNSMANMHIRDQFTGADQLIIGNGQDYNKHKFAYHSSKCIFIGYSPSHKGYKCLHPSGRVYVARHVTFDESVFPYATEFVFHSHAKTDSQISHSHTPQQIHHISSLPVNNSTGNLNSVRSGSSSSSHSDHLEQTATDQNSQQATINDRSPFHTCPTIVESIQNIPEPPHHSLPIQSHHPSNTSFYPYTQPNTHQMITRSKAGIFKPKIYTAVLTHKEPDTVQEALNDSKWLQAMREEYDALIKNNTWTLVPRQADQHVVGNKWVYRIKYNTDGSVAKYKARLVAKGFQQVAGINYFETFSPVVKSATVRVILSLAVMNQWRIRQVDVNNAFLNGELTEEVFMSQPDGFIDAQRSDFVCKLHKSLYGLKQAPRAWYDKLKGCLISWGFTTTSSDTSLFVRKIKTSMIIVLIYVDDILITGPNTEELEGFITEFSKTFALKDLGVLSYFLGIEVLYDADCMYLSQRKYIRDLLSKVEMTECKGIDTPMSTGSKLQKIVQGELGYYLEDPTHYRSIVGGMQYLILTRPEIAFAVNKLSQYVAAPTLQHLMACKRVLRYLKATQDYGLKFFREGSLTLTSFTDADWACDLDDRKSVGAYCIYLDIMTKPLSFVRFNYLRSKLNVHLCPLSLRGAVRAAHYAEQKKVKTKMKKIQSKLQGKCVSSASSANSSAD
ncbi:retrovirus-related pol polyprotein from transposon RE1 [Citrus sinensis]|uniref:Retrovirus-related pol polyprotein from transposon RE1 n=1 Tax=Citrus sinensis TaxID=2711 RepID=A0ACB8HSB2_CITSI|nr:retrovirus-related pol polyprotein from transposon RE1 [Citrus sinensis]